jgi:hypothetical protein
MMRLFKPFSPTCGAWAAALALCWVAPMATAQSALTPVQTTLQAPVQTSGKAVSGRVSEPVNEAVSSAASTAAKPATPATETTTETPSAPSSPAPTSATVEAPQATDWDRMLEVAEPLITNPLIGAGALLALMLILAVLMYRRNKRNDALVLSSPQWVNDEPEVNGDPLLPTRGLQAEIMALDLELGPSVAPTHASAHAFSAPQQSMPATPSSEDLSLSKLQWAQQLLAAGEYELARVLLTSVAETLHSQLQQRGDSTQGPRQ